MKLTVHTLRALKDNFVYVISEPAGQCAVVDPGEARPVVELLRRTHFEITHILCTHHHSDHIQGVGELLEYFPQAQVWCSAYDRSRIPQATRSVYEATPLELFSEPLRVLEVPGHTLGQIAYWLPNQAAIFPGDTLFSCGCGRLFEGSHWQMFSSLQKFKALPPETSIYFGHEYTLRNIEFVLEKGGGDSDLTAFYKASEENLAAGHNSTPTTLSTELRFNPFLRAANVDEFRQWREQRNLW